MKDLAILSAVGRSAIHNFIETKISKVSKDLLGQG